MWGSKVFSIFKSLQLIVPLVIRLYNKISTKGITRHNGEFNRKKTTTFVAMVLMGIGIVYGTYFCILRYNGVVQQNVLLSNEVANLKVGINNYDTAMKVLEQARKVTRYNLELVDEVVKLRKENMGLKIQLGMCELENGRVDKQPKE